ncbi:MAG: DMT family transporter [Paludibacteraceae bacterium]|nr:DMT family transporter [Paludibacteraceae bacterium]
MWVLLAFISALCLGGYDISKKIALRNQRVINVLTLSVLISSLILSIPLVLSRVCPQMMSDTLFFVPEMEWHAHLLTFVKSCIVLCSWIFSYMSLKHLPISVVSPWQATRPMWTLIGALLIFGERLNSWQWAGVLLAIGSIFAFSFKKPQHTAGKRGLKSKIHDNKYYICLALAILLGACSGLYDKYMMRHFDHNAVQVYYTLYQAVLMVIVWMVENRKNIHLTHSRRRSASPASTLLPSFSVADILPIIMISVFLVISDNVYMLALSDPSSLIAVVSTIRRGGTVLGFAYGLIYLKEPDPWKKVLAMLGILAGLTCLALGTL